MIYLARSLFLLGSTFMTLGIAAIGIKIVFEEDLPEALQGHWGELVVVTIIYFALSVVGQRLGNDLVGTGAKVNKAIEGETIRFEKMKWYDQYLYLNFFSSIIRNIKG